MTTQSDFKEFLTLLEKNNVDYVIVGGYAVAFHGYPRFTKDLDIFYRDTESNIHNVRLALIEFGFQAESIPESIFSPGAILNFGVEPIRIDLLNRIDGVAFSDAIAHSIRGFYGDQQVTFIGIDDLKKNKASTGRLQDSVDFVKLKERTE